MLGVTSGFPEVSFAVLAFVCAMNSVWFLVDWLREYWLCLVS